jgi:hypothetical protein
VSNGVKARRSVLENLKPTAETHAGLLLQRYLTAHKPKQRDNTQDRRLKSMLLGAQPVQSLRLRSITRRSIAGWSGSSRRRLRGAHGFTSQCRLPRRLQLVWATPARWRLAFGCSHTYGMPLLPASALKGLCRRVARLLTPREQTLGRRN